MAPHRRKRSLQVSDSSSSEGLADEVDLAEDEVEEAEAADEEDEIEVLNSPVRRSSSDGATRDAFSANPNLSLPTITSNRPFSSTFGPPFSSANPDARPLSSIANSNGSPRDILFSSCPPNINSHTRAGTSAELLSSLHIQVDASSAPLMASQHPALEAYLQSRGVRPVSQWLDACVASLAACRGGFLQLPISQQAESCFSRFLLADLNTMGAAALPHQFHTLHAIELAGPFVLQVDEISDIGSAIRQRYKERPASASRCLKLSMTDGVQRVYGIEYRPIRDLNVLSPAGLKIVVHHVNIRRGLLMLVPEIVIVLGGQVEYLEAARQRVVQHVNKPPRGVRNIRGTRPQSLVESASTAAWATHQTGETTRSGGLRTGQMDQLSRAPAPGPANGFTNENTEGRTPHDTDNFLPRGVEHIGITYLSLLKEKWASSQRDASDMQGKIKGVLTGVKEFHFKNLERFRLVVYVDDGSQIASLLIHHHVVERLVGFSPGQVSAALASSCPNEVTKMKGNLNRFQAFLANFEGILLLHRDDETNSPVVIEMTEGCPKHEAWFLAERLQGERRIARAADIETIELSP